jgi:hypothetical protein
MGRTAADVKRPLEGIGTSIVHGLSDFHSLLNAKCARLQRRAQGSPLMGIDTAAGPCLTQRSEPQ